ncbi:MAG: hypothetical protein EXS55_03080 [Candidatus Magasanikbacteria bacterium]|nr:hypothetical protein [Candidatus Magasanikbacteria bacterium]
MRLIRWFLCLFGFGSERKCVVREIWILREASVDESKPLGSQDNPLTASTVVDVDRRYKFCLCSVCGVAGQCTPSSDYWGKDGKNLLCESCLGKELRGQGMNVDDLHKPPTRPLPKRPPTN